MCTSSGATYHHHPDGSSSSIKSLTELSSWGSSVAPGRSSATTTLLTNATVGFGSTSDDVNEASLSKRPWRYQHAHSWSACIPLGVSLSHPALAAAFLISVASRSAAAKSPAIQARRPAIAMEYSTK